MRYYTIQAPQVLAPYVKCYWVLEDELPSNSSYVYRSMADTCVEMVFHYRGTFDELTADNTTRSSFKAGLNGQTSHYNRFVTHESFALFGVYLYPFALPALFNISAEAVSNEMPDLQQLLGSEGKQLEEQVMLAATNQVRADILSSFFIKKLSKSDNPVQPIFSSVMYLLQAQHAVNITTLANDYFLSMRQFERKFKACAGFTPKLYARIARFQQALKQYGSKQKSLTRIAYDCGYYDQAHFIHDFKSFSGHNPQHFFAGGSEGAEWRDC
ncbi:MAG: AraC family transcriptional regulator [Filimonas sp.]|nr:AraC family transcriptional regulator [Filimonas sp.]